MSAATPPAACLAAIRHSRKVHDSSSLLRDTGAAIGGLSVVEFQELVAKGIDKIDATDNVPTVYVAKVAGLLPGMLTTSDVVTLSETGTAIGTMSVADIAGLAGKCIDRIDATDDVLSLTVAKYLGLGTVALTAADMVTIQTGQSSYTLPSTADNLESTGDGKFTGTGNASANVMTGGVSADSLSGLAGNDMLIGGGGWTSCEAGEIAIPSFSALLPARSTLQRSRILRMGLTRLP